MHPRHHPVAFLLIITLEVGCFGKGWQDGVGTFSGEVEVFPFGADETNIYWTDMNGKNDSADVLQAPLGAQKLISLASLQENSMLVAVDSTTGYWTSTD